MDQSGGRYAPVAGRAGAAFEATKKNDTVMNIVNWRHEALFLTITGMESCWVVGWSRVLLKQPRLAVAGLSWWSVMLLYILALTTARALGRLELRRGSWYIGIVALVCAVVFLYVNLGGTLVVLRHPSDPSAAVEVLVLLFALLVWFRALRIPGEAGDMRSITRQFQIGLFILVGAVLVTLRSPTQLNDLVLAYFGFGLLAMALTRIEEVAMAEPGGAAPFDLKWAATLLATLFVVGTIALLTTKVFTVEAARWVLRPLVSLLQVILFLSLVLATELALLVLPLLRWLIGDISMEDVQKGMEDMQRFAAPFPEDEASETARLSPQLVEALQVSVIVLLVLIALWVVVRSFRRWRADRYVTPGGVRETVASEGSLAEDLAAYLRDQWRRLREADLRRRFQRLGTGSVRVIYANLLALMAALGRPRQPEQTPFEYEPVAEETLPERQAEISAITEAYARARYGELEISAEELARLQEAWERVRAEGKELL
jgi:hypothetical protein